MIIACIDGGLFCIPAMILYAILSSTGVLVVFKRFKWCKKKCVCDCHDHTPPIHTCITAPKQHCKACTRLLASRKPKTGWTWFNLWTP